MGQCETVEDYETWRMSMYIYMLLPIMVYNPTRYHIWLSLFFSITSGTTLLKTTKDKGLDQGPIMTMALEIPPVTWYKDAGLRRLYIMMPILFLGATTNGYDGSLLNGLQTMTPWQER